MSAATAREQIAQLEVAIAAQEALRPVLGGQVVDAALGALRAQLAALRVQAAGSSLVHDLQELQSADLIRRLPAESEPAYNFKHALTQDAAYGSLLFAERKSLHAATARVLEAVAPLRSGAQASIIAEHYLRAEAWDEAVPLLLEAGDAAARTFAHPEARLHYARALDTLARMPQSEANRRLKVDTILKQVSVSLRAMGPAESLARLREAEGLVPSPSGEQAPDEQDRLRLARIHFWMGHAHTHASRGREAIQHMRQVLVEAQTLDDEELRAVPSAIIGRALALQGHFATAEPMLSQALPLLAKIANWPEWILSQAMLALSLAAQGRPAEAIAHVHAGLSRAEELNYATGKAQCHVSLANVYGMCRDGEAMRRHAQAGLDIARAAGDRLITYIGDSLLAWALGRLGEQAQAAESWAEAELVGRRIGDSLVFGDWFAAARAEFALTLGRLDEACILAESVVARAQASNSLYAPGLAQRTWAEALAALDPGRMVEAETHLTESLRLLEGGNALLEAAHTHAAWAALLRSRDPEAARRHQALANRGLERAS